MNNRGIEMRRKNKFGVILFLMIIITALSIILSDSRGSRQFIKSQKSENMASKNEKNKKKIKSEKYNGEMEFYNGEIEHLFFHPLILDKKAAFTGPKWHTDNMDNWLVTVEESKKVINSLYSKGYILIDPNSLYEEYESDGKKLFRKKPLKVPKGKKPLILSIDDLSYNEGMRKATALKLILDENGNLATYRKDQNGKEIIGYDEIVMILDRFIKEHPDFSLNGAKGVIALTGYEGVFGYRTNLDSKNREEEAKKAKVIANKLKENGWKFASHSYGHLDNAKIPFQTLKRDADKWEQLVKPIIGDTSIYVYPHGTAIKTNSEKFKYLQSKGFKIFYSVDSYLGERISENDLVVEGGRMPIDGLSMRNRREAFLKFFDAKEVLDLESRPKR
ncbi:hypothetical protein DP130_04655 [Clostridium tetani]|uniref:NodB homology domain-containing protein n=2 Tax=Clostridium tetani TaxID=1513 RepID=A0A4Q0VCG8_CLOTA|nr:hypothetical protein DP130_04655 [Clostridium tetani]